MEVRMHDLQPTEEETEGEEVNSLEPRACDSKTLVRMAVLAEKQDFNRQVDIEELESIIDPDGIHILDANMPFGVPYHRASFGPSKEPIWPDHHRCYVLCKVSDQTEPMTFWLDIAATDYEAMMTVGRLKEKMDDPIEMGIAMAHAAAASEEDE